MSNFKIAKTFELILGLEKKYLKVEKLEMEKILIFGIRRIFFRSVSLFSSSSSFVRNETFSGI